MENLKKKSVLEDQYMKTKKCNKCGLVKSLNEFHIRKKSVSDGRGYSCKECVLEYHKKTYQENPEKYKEIQKRWVRKNPIKKWSMVVLVRKRGLGFDVRITFDELYQMVRNIKVCYYCGRNLVYRNKNRACDNSASLDRINNSKIISKNTVRVVCIQCNKTKQNRTHNQFVEYCKKIVSKFE